MEDEKLWLVVGDKEVQQTLYLGQIVDGLYQTLHYSRACVVGACSAPAAKDCKGTSCTVDKRLILVHLITIKIIVNRTTAATMGTAMAGGTLTPKATKEIK